MNVILLTLNSYFLQQCNAEDVFNKIFCFICLFIFSIFNPRLKHN